MHPDILAPQPSPHGDRRLTAYTHAATGKFNERDVTMRHSVYWSLLASLSLLPQMGVAQTPPVAETGAVDASAEQAPTAPGYAEAVQRAVSEFDLGNYAEARAAFREAHALYPNARTLRGLGKAEFELKNYRACIEYLEQALASEKRPLDGALRKDAEQLLRTAKGYVAHYSIQLDPVEQAHITLDGRTIELGEGGSLVIEVGDHLLEVQAAGYRAERRELRVAGGKAQVLHVKLRELPRSESETRRKRRIWAWSLASVALVGAAAGLAVALTRDDTLASPEAGNADAWGTVTAMHGTALGSW